LNKYVVMHMLANRLTTTEIGADSYSVAQSGIAHFYRNIPGRTPHPRETQPSQQLIASVTSPRLITVKDDPGVSWSPESPPEPETPVTHALPLSYDELMLLRQGLKELDPGKQCAVDSKLDAKLYAAQTIVKTRAGLKTVNDLRKAEDEERTKRIVITYFDTDGRVRKHAEQVDTKMCPPEIHVDLRNPTSRNPVRNPLSNEPMGPGEVSA
jgi:hypothetical protein